MELIALGNRRRRLGLTSPPLVGVEVNPGPGLGHTKAHRREAKDRTPKVPRKRKFFTCEETASIKFGIKAGIKKIKIAETLGRDYIEVLKKGTELKRTKDIKVRKPTGRPHELSAKDEFYIVLISLRNRKWSCERIAEYIFKDKSKRKMVNRVLLKHNLKSCRARKKPMLREQNIAHRKKWAWEHLNWTQEQWYDTVWSDESPFLRWCTRAGQRVRRRPGEALLPECTEKTLKFGGGKIMVWGAVTARGVGPLKRIDGIMSKASYHSILMYHAMPYVFNLAQKRKEEEKSNMSQ